jgi:hypothetical protein
MDNLMNFVTVENITVFIALWGAVLSTAKVLLDYSKNIRKLKVQLGIVIQKWLDSTTLCVSTTAMNIGRALLSFAVAETKNKEKVFLFFPVTLTF